MVGAQALAPLRDPALRAAVIEAAPSADLAAASVLGEGWACTAYRILTPGGALALRVPKPGSWWAAPDLERETRLLPALEGWGLPVPRGARLLRGADGSVLGALQSVIEGTPLARAPRGRALRARIADGVGAFLARLHALSSAEVRALGVKDVDIWEGHYAPMIERCLPLLPMGSARWLDGRARAFLDGGGVRAAPRVLIHADCSGDHLLTREDGSLAGVIDWADAMLGDPALDFAALLDDHPEGFVREVIGTYEHHGGDLDGDALRRAAFYLDVAPLFGVLFADDAGFPELARQDRRRFSGHAAAATRAARAARGVR